MLKYFRYKNDVLVAEFGTDEVSLTEIRNRKKMLYDQFITEITIDFTQSNLRLLADAERKYGDFDVVHHVDLLERKITIKTKTPETMTMLLLECGFTTES